MSDIPTEFGPQDSGRYNDFAARLVADLRPVRRLASPWIRACGWLAVVLALAVALGAFANTGDMEERLMAEPDMWLAVLGSTLTFVLAAFAAFQLSLPDRSAWWALLPLPAVALWIGASGMGCARTFLIPGTTDAGFGDAMHCMSFIIGLSVPLSVLIFVMLRRGFSLYPSLTGAVAGLAVAAAAATLLNFFHPYDAAITDLTIHAVAVLMVVLANRFFVRRASKADGVLARR